MTSLNPGLDVTGADNAPLTHGGAAAVSGRLVGHGAAQAAAWNHGE